MAASCLFPTLGLSRVVQDRFRTPEPVQEVTENSHGQDLTVQFFHKDVLMLVGENEKKYFSSWDLLPIETW